MVYFVVLWFVFVGLALLEAAGVIKSQTIEQVMHIWIIAFVIFVFLGAYQQARSKLPEDIYSKLADATQMYYRGQKAPTGYMQGIRLARNLGFTPKWDFQQNFWAEHEGRVIDISKVGWIQRTDEDSIPCYGFVFSCHLRTPVRGTTILVSDSLLAKAKGVSGGLKRIKLEWLAFEEQFDLFSTDEQEARVVMAPDVMVVLYDFYQAVHNKSFCFVFYGDTLSCFYSMGAEGNLLEKEDMQYLFCNLYLLRYIPVFLKDKLIVRDWQEEEYLAKRKKEHVHYVSTYVPANVPDAQGITPLMYSVLNDDLDAFKKLISDPSVNINQCYQANGNTLLHLAAANNRVEMVECLLAFEQINLDALNKAGQTALDIAKNRRYQAIIDLLESAKQ